MDINELLDKELTLEVPEYGTLTITPREFLKIWSELDREAGIIRGVNVCRSYVDDLIENGNKVRAYTLEDESQERILLVMEDMDGFGGGVLLPKTILFGEESIEEYMLHSIHYLKIKCRGTFYKK